jgi:streptomycin 6-kinase
MTGGSRSIPRVWWGSGALLRNPYPEPLTREMLSRRADQLAEELSLDRDRIWSWAWAQAHLATAWSVQDGEDPAYWLACAELLA